MSASLHSLRPYSRNMHPPRRALRTELVAATLTWLAIILPAAVIISLLP